MAKKKKQNITYTRISYLNDFVNWKAIFKNSKFLKRKPTAHQKRKINQIYREVYAIARPGEARFYLYKNKENLTKRLKLTGQPSYLKGVFTTKKRKVKRATRKYLITQMGPHTFYEEPFDPYPLDGDELYDQIIDKAKARPQGTNRGYIRAGTHNIGESFLGEQGKELARIGRRLWEKYETMSENQLMRPGHGVAAHPSKWMTGIAWVK